MKRREFLLSLGIGMATISLADVLPRIIRGRELVRPPGAVAEDFFNAVCIRCGRCAQICPTGAIVLAGLGDGFKEIGTPRIDALKGPCERIQGKCEKQARCAEICPTKAILQVDRRAVKMGSAVMNADRCIAWRGGSCLVCYEVCPVRDAISLIDEARPIFHADICFGCGRCVYACPARPKALSLSPKGERRPSPA